jgi:hypothetical protein
LPSIRGIPGPYRFFFYSFDCVEPMHIHVELDEATCKFWLRPLTLAANNGFSPRDLNRIRSIIQDHLEVMQDHLEVMTHAWNQHCGST